MKTKISTIALIVISATLSLNVIGKEIAITFDDSPKQAGGYFSGPERARKLLASLQKSKVKEVAFFAVSSRLNKEGTERLKAYANAGHFIANHTHTHPDFNTLTSSEFKENFKTAHEALSSFPNFQKWFRFPYLREGNELKKRNQFRNTLKMAGYKNGYITINNYDWYMDEQFQKNTDVDLKKLKNYYVNNLMDAVDFYNKLALQHLKRSPKHILLLHETDINALFISDLIKALRSEGWKIISPKEAYTDPISNFQLPSLMKYNPGRIGEIAHQSDPSATLWPITCNESHLDELYLKKVLQ